MIRRSLPCARGITRILTVAAILGWLAIAPAPAQDFRVDTEVFVGEEEEKSPPVIETLTLFADGLVYDFLLTGSREITVFDPRMQHFTLLDPKQKLKTVITLQEVNESCISLNLHAAQSKDPFFVFAAEPKFEVTEEATKNGGQDATRLTMDSEWLVYTAVGRKPELAGAALAYRGFADAQNRLNALFMGGMLPAPRAKLNEELAARGLLPAEVTRVILPQNRFQKKVEARSRHLVNWTLSRPDRDKIEEVGSFRVSFESVPFEKYREIGRQAVAEQQAKR